MKEIGEKKKKSSNPTNVKLENFEEQGSRSDIRFVGWIQSNPTQKEFLIVKIKADIVRTNRVGPRQKK